ncbi:hypothetical protein B0H13DRAFT_2354905 [Mycena leptocephala]|nr:hypothetical protein B0H13DRAFT_2354905 [Mycena leptocephala]
MSYHVLSVLLSSSPERFPDTHAALVAESLGLANKSKSNLVMQLSAQRKILVTEHTTTQTAKSIFVDLDTLPNGTLLSLAFVHGLEVPENANSKVLRDSIATHIAMGFCTRELPSSLACSAISLQSDSHVTSGSDDPSTRLQMHIMRQIAPILAAQLLKRLLDMHDVTYADTDNLRKLRHHLQSFLDRLDYGKCSEDEPSIMGSARRARRTEIRASTRPRR